MPGPFGVATTWKPRSQRSITLFVCPWLYRTTLIPLNVPMAAPSATSLAQWALLYMRESPTNVAPPYIAGATTQMPFGHHRCDSLVTTDAAAKAAVVCPDGNDW